MLSEMRSHHRQRRQVIYRNAKCVVDRGSIVNIEYNDPVGARGFDELRHVTCVYRVTGFGAAVFPRVSEIRDYGYYAGSTCVAQALQEKQQSYQSLRDRRLWCSSE
jgi:hypothetical protein